jgi:glucose/arabinose dehydrogenase
MIRLQVIWAILGTGFLAIAWPVDADPLLQTTSPVPSCGELGEIVIRPAVDSEVFCPEYLLPELPSSAVAALASIAYAPTCDESEAPQAWCGRLFYVRPDTGSVYWLGDYDPATHTYLVHTFAENLDLSTGLVYRDGAWYVAGDRTIYRLTDEDGDGHAEAAVTLVDNLPGGAGQLTGSVAVGPDGRLYASKGATCNACDEADPRRAALLSYDLDGAGEQIVATGLYAPFDFAWNPADHGLWLTESGPAGLGEELPLDALIRLDSPDADFGWPACIQGVDGPVPNPAYPSADESRCAATASATIAFPAHSHPAGIAWYAGTAFPELVGDLLLVTSGAWNQRLPIGYTLYRVCFNNAGALEPCLQPDGTPARVEPGLPASVERLAPVYDFYPDQGAIQLQIQDQGFYPDHPVDVAVSPEGWITISLQEGRIIRLRPMLSG